MGNEPEVPTVKGKAKKRVSSLQNPTVVNLPVVRDVQTSQIDRLIEMALDKNLDLDRLEKLIIMKREEDAQRAKKAYYSALSEFQFTVPKIIKRSNVNYQHKDGKGETDYNYADIEEIKDSIREPLHKVGLTYSWDQDEKDNSVSVTCIITHVDGHQERSKPLSGPFDTSGSKGPIHSKASTISYLRRYTLTGILGLTSAESDDDGHKGDRVKPQQTGTSTKVKFDDTKMNNAVELILAGKKTLAEIREQADLTPEQEKALETTEKNYLVTKNLHTPRSV